MRILVDAIIFQKDPHGGIARLFREILPRLCDLDPEINITLFCDGPLLSKTPAHNQIQIRHTPPIRRIVRLSGFWGTLLYPIRRIASRSWNYARNFWLRDDKEAIWHSTFFTLPNNWEGPIVVTIYDMIHEVFQDLYNSPLDNVARRNKQNSIEQASVIICISEATRTDVENFYDNNLKEIIVIPIASSPTFHRLSPQELKPFAFNHPYILYVGNRVHYKNFSGLLKLFSQWDGRFQNDLVVVGKPWDTSELELINDLGLSEKVFLLNNVDDSQLCQLYNQAQSFVFPSIYEGFGIPILEALACGCPVVASRIPSSVEVGGNCLFYFDVSNPNDFIAALNQSIINGHDPEWIQRGLEHTKLFSWEKTAQKTLEVYRSISQK